MWTLILFFSMSASSNPFAGQQVPGFHSQAACVDAYVQIHNQLNARSSQSEETWKQTDGLVSRKYTETKLQVTDYVCIPVTTSLNKGGAK